MNFFVPILQPPVYAANHFSSGDIMFLAGSRFIDITLRRRKKKSFYFWAEERYREGVTKIFPARRKEYSSNNGQLRFNATPSGHRIRRT